MKIVPGQIGPEGARYEGEEPAAILELDESQVRAGGPVCYALDVQVVSGRLVVRGRVWSEVEFACARCAEFFRMRVEEPAFEAVLDGVNPGEVVDLTPDIREATILAFPARAVCKPDCAGLRTTWGEAPSAGRDAGGNAPPGRGPWSALEGLELE